MDLIQKDQVWQHKESGNKVLVLRVSGFRLTYQDQGSLKVVSQSEFLSDFINISTEQGVGNE